MIQYSSEITKAISLSELGADTVKVTARARAWRRLVWPLHNTTRALTDFGRPENSYSDNFVATPCSPAKKKHPAFYSESSSRVKSTHFPRVVVDPDPIRLNIYIYNLQSPAAQALIPRPASGLIFSAPVVLHFVSLSPDWIPHVLLTSCFVRSGPVYFP